MKKKISVILSIICVLSLLCSCQPAEVSDPTEKPADATAELTAVPTEEATPTSTPEPTEEATPTPTKDPYLHFDYTKTTVFDFADRADKVATVNTDLGWSFEGSDSTAEYNFKGGKLVMSGMEDNKFYRNRINLSTEQRDNNCNATAMDANNALAIYIENNSNETVGFCYFGELKLPGVASEHQNVYNATLFDDLEVYLIDTDNNILSAIEYDPVNSAFLDKGLAEIPAHFKGYFVVTFESFGKDMCYYAGWGYHDPASCNNAAYVKGASINAVGYCLFKEINEDDTDTFVIGEYCFLNIKK